VPAPPANNTWAQSSQIDRFIGGYTISHPFLPCAELFTLDTDAQDIQHITDCDTDMLTEEGESTG
jgi:hypothetical protein